MDKAYGTYSARTAVTSNICVKCPKCGGPGMVTADDEFEFWNSCSVSAYSNPNEKK